MVTRFAERFLKVYREEQASFLLVFFLFLCMRASNIMVENYAETAFLKRYGVQYLPQVFLVNSITLFAVITTIGLFLDRMSRTMLLRRLLLILAGLLVIARLLLPWEISILYPLLYVLVAQSRYALVVVFWVIGSDLFTFRQTKRLFPPIEAGGVLGVILGSFASGPLGRLLSIDNILVAASLILLGAVAVTYRIEGKIPKVVTDRPRGAQSPKETSKKKAGLSEVLPLIRGSRFLLMLVVLIIVPNFLLPIFNFQWSVILDLRFASEGGLLMFYSIFKGVSNALNLVVLLFIGRAFARFGVTTILFFHPANYALIFGALLGSFTLPVAIYGRISSNILRTSANRPAMYMLFNFIPPEYRGRMVSFLQGTAGRLGTLLGSVLLLVGSPFIDPRLFGLIGCLAALVWLSASWRLSRVYTSTVFDSLMAGNVDFGAMDKMDMGSLLDKPTVERLLQALEEDEASAALAAQLLATKADAEVAARMLALVPERTETVQVAILDAVGEMGPVGLCRELEALAGRLPPVVAARCVATLGQTDSVAGKTFMARCLSQAAPVVRAQAAAAIFQTGNEELMERARVSLLALLDQGMEERTAALDAIPATGDYRFIEPLGVLADEADPHLKATVARSLGRLRQEGGVNILVQLLNDGSPDVRSQAALSLGELTPGLPEVVEALTERLNDEEPEVVEAALTALVAIGDTAIPHLLHSLSEAPLHLREAILRLLSELEMPEGEILGPVKSEMEAAYGLVAEQATLDSLEESPARQFLLDALRTDLAARIRAIFRLLQVTGLGRELDLVERGLRSADRRKQAVAVEGMENVIHRDLGRLLVPLVEEVPLRERLVAGTKAFGAAPLPLEEVVKRYFDSNDSVLKIGACALVEERGENHRWSETLRRLALEGPPEVASQARALVEEEVMVDALTTLDKVLFLRKVELFKTLDVRALTAIAIISEECSVAAGETICHEGEEGDAMFCVVTGTVEVLKERPDGRFLELAKVGPPEVLGEMALFEGEPRSATLRANEQTTILSIDRASFEDIMHEYPQIGISASRILSRRLRKAGVQESRLPS
jgi:ATP/ADP translocase/HEAT repeat protein